MGCGKLENSCKQNIAQEPSSKTNHTHNIEFVLMTTKPLTKPLSSRKSHVMSVRTARYTIDAVSPYSGYWGLVHQQCASLRTNQCFR
jgi:hypothetical protein